MVSQIHADVYLTFKYQTHTCTFSTALIPANIELAAMLQQECFVERKIQSEGPRVLNEQAVLCGLLWL